MTDLSEVVVNSYTFPLKKKTERSLLLFVPVEFKPLFHSQTSFSRSQTMHEGLVAVEFDEESLYTHGPSCDHVRVPRRRGR